MVSFAVAVYGSCGGALFQIDEKMRDQWVTLFERNLARVVLSVC